MDAPPTRYAKSDDLLIAYQVLGSGALDLVFVQGYIWTCPGSVERRELGLRV